MLTVEALTDYGADTAEGLSRCFGKADFYLRLVKTIPADQTLDKLSEALAAGDVKTAFEHAHALKGVLGNLSLTPILKPVAEMTELLRAGSMEGCDALAAEAVRQRDALKAICE